MLALLTGSVGKWALYGAVALSLCGGVAVIKHQYDAGIIAKVAAKEAAVNLETERADSARLVVALTTRATVAEAQAASLSHIREAIARAKPSNSCAASGPVRAVVAGLRGDAGNR